VFAPVHASVSGRVAGIVNWPHPAAGRGPAVVIDSDGSDNVSRIPNPAPPDSLTPAQLRSLIFEAGITGMGGAGFPAHIKLNPPRPVDALIINGAECEPYLTADYRLMLEKAGEIIKGVTLAARCLSAKNIFIAIEDNKPEAIEALGYGIRDTGIGMRILKSAYPQGGEKQLIKNLLGKEVPSGKLPFDVGVVVHNVATIFAIYEAAYLGKPLYERVVTVSGSCIANPKNLLVRLGTPISELINYCGLKEEPAKIIAGGPMMGIAQFSVEAPVIKSTSGVICLSREEAAAAEGLPCIRCGSCVRECPAGLMPCLINLAAEKGLWPQAQAFRALDCIECGLCSYVCPANRRLAQSIKIAKLEAAK
jgi:electron transport complex protein RnfC